MLTASGLGLSEGCCLQGIVGNVPWQALVYLTLWLQLIGMTNATAGKNGGGGRERERERERERRRAAHASDQGSTPKP